MTKFTFTARVGISVYTEVEAETLEEAIAEAENRPLMAIVRSGRDTEQEAWMCDELDGTPYDIKEEE